MPFAQAPDNAAANKRVIINTEEHSRGGKFSYTKPTLSDALDIFFPEGQEVDAFVDADEEERMTRNDAESIFQGIREIRFYNTNGELTIISADPSSD